MKKLALILLAAASLVGRPAPPRRSGMAAALPIVVPIRAMRDRYRAPYYDDRSYYQQRLFSTRSLSDLERFQRGWTVQNGLCKPYRGY